MTQPDKDNTMEERFDELLENGVICYGTPPKTNEFGLVIDCIYKTEDLVPKLKAFIASEKERSRREGEEKLIKLIDWATSDDTGTSSEFLCRYMLGLKPGNTWGISAPADRSDRGRCIRLLNKFPEWWERLEELNKYSQWSDQIPLIRSEALTPSQQSEDK
jgi:hypothetical protein